MSSSLENHQVLTLPITTALGSLATVCLSAFLLLAPLLDFVGVSSPIAYVLFTIFFLPVVVVLFLSLIAYLYFMQRHPTSFDFSVSRILPTFAVSDGTVPVRVQLGSSGEMKGMILREHFPKGWKLVLASPPPSSLDNVDGMARWIIKPNEKPAMISYLLQLPQDAKNGEFYDFRGWDVKTGFT